MFFRNLTLFRFAEKLPRSLKHLPSALDEHRLSAQEQLEEALFTGLRLTQGIDRANFSARFGVDPWIRYSADLSDYVREGLMWTSEDTFGLTRRGMLVDNEIMLTFV